MKLFNSALNGSLPKSIRRAAKVSEYSADASEQEKITGKFKSKGIPITNWQVKTENTLPIFHICQAISNLCF